MAHVTRRRRGRLVVLALVAVLMMSACRPSGERRLVSLREGELGPGGLEGTLVYVETRGVRQSDLYIHDLATDQRERLRLGLQGRGYRNSPAWSPDGRRIAFSLTLDDGYSHIHTVSESGRDLRQVTHGEVVDDHPRWSPDGEEIVFSSIRDGDYDWRLFRVPARGGQPEQIGSDDGHSVFPDWSPDGRYVVYANRSEGSYKLRLYDVVDGTDRQLTDGPGEDLYPQFSPDGRRVLFSSNREDDVWQILTIDLATDELARVIGSDSMDEFPVFSPDGRFIAFSAGHLAVYRSDGSELPGGKLRWRVTQNLAWAPDWKASR